MPRSKKYSKKSRNPNAWILFSNEFYKFHCQKGTKRSDAMKLAKYVWDRMSKEQKCYYYYLSDQKRLGFSKCKAKPGELMFVHESPVYEKQAEWKILFDEIINEKMLQDQ
jgi:hypothetical protein